MLQFVCLEENNIIQGYTIQLQYKTFFDIKLTPSFPSSSPTHQQQQSQHHRTHKLKLTHQQYRNMSFSSHSPKYPPIYKSTLKQLGRVGPGTYNPYKNNNILTNQGSSCVFKSKIQRSQDQSMYNNNKKNQNSNDNNNNQNNVENNSNNVVGPGYYQTQQAYQKIIRKKISHGCQASFNSKQQRFPQNPNSQSLNSHSHSQQSQPINIYQMLIKTQQKSKQKQGKLYGITRDRNFISNSIPSIPSCEQSYGYRIDPKSKKLVQNQNPNVLLARRTLVNGVDGKMFNSTANMNYNYNYNNNSDSSMIYNGPGCYFNTRIINKNIKGPKWVLPSTSNTDTNNKQNTQNNQNSNVLNNSNTGYSIQQIYNKRWLQKGNILTSKQNRFDYGYGYDHSISNNNSNSHSNGHNNSNININGNGNVKINKKRQLLTNALKRQFGEYYAMEIQQSNNNNNNGDIADIDRNISRIIQQKMYGKQYTHQKLNNNRANYGSHSKQQNTKNIQCFLSKNSRFEYNKNSQNITNSGNNNKSPCKNNKIQTQSSTKQKQQQKNNVGFGSKSQRFNHDIQNKFNNRKIGPGTYDTNNNGSIKNNISNSYGNNKQQSYNNDTLKNSIRL